MPSEHDCFDSPLIAGCVAVVAEIVRRWGATSYRDAIAAIERIEQRQQALERRLEREQWRMRMESRPNV